MEGRVLSKKLRIKRKLGSGGMGAVYEVENIHNKTKLAIKLLKEEAAASEEVRARFISESSRMFRLIHPNIVRALDYDFEEGFGAYFTMDLVHGKDLKQLLEEDRAAGKPPWPIDRIKRIGTEVASALHYAHSKWSLVHRDIKPANILIREEDGAAIVTDFGIAKRTQRVEGETTDFTTTERFVGTVRYSSPEQLMVEELDQRADIYSLGAVLYEMATGRRFLERMKESEIQARTMYFPDWDWKAELPFPEGMLPALRELVEACVERRPGNRIATAGDLIERLGRCDERHIEIVSVPKPVEDQTIVPGFDDIRGKLRQEAEVLLQQLAELGQVALSVGVEIEPEKSDTFRARLEAIAQIERAGAYNDAVHQLGEFGELVEREHGALQQRVREAIDQSRDEVAEAWADLVARANGLIDERRTARFESTLTEIVASLGGEDWRAASARLAEAREVQAEAEANARRLAERETREAVESIRLAAGQLEQNEALPAGFDRAAIETQIETALAEGRYAEARAAARTALNGLEVARADWIGRQRQRAVAARDAMTAFLRDLDIQAMPDTVAPIVRRAQELARNGDAALRNDDYTAAAEGLTTR
jgi:serine/threonine-protein kinase